MFAALGLICKMPRNIINVDIVCRGLPKKRGFEKLGVQTDLQGLKLASSVLSRLYTEARKRLLLVQWLGIIE